MKRLTCLWMAFMCVLILRAEKITVTLADFDHLPTTYGALSNGNHCFTTNVTSGMAGLTITTTDVALGSQYVNESYGNCLSLTTTDTDAHTITLTAPSGYVITGYSMAARSNTSGANHVLTPSKGGNATTSTIGTLYQNAGYPYLTANPWTPSTTFTIQTQNKGNTLYIPYFTVTLRSIASTVTNGTYYRLHSIYAPTCCMTELNGRLYAKTTEDGLYNQVWKIEESAGKYTLQGALSDKYIQEAYQSTQVLTNTTPHTFTLRSKTQDGMTLFTFDEGTNANKALHCADTYNVVGWVYSENKSWWALEEVDINADDLAATQNLLINDYTTQLRTFFTDDVCQQLKDDYKNLSDDALRTAMSTLPTALQDMAVSVKKGVWTPKADNIAQMFYNLYEKDFRIHSYDIFSNSDLWDDITKTGPFAHLFHPTGIQATTGQTIMLFVGSDVKDSDATLQAECVAGTNRRGDAYTLHQGYNAIYVPYDCEIFISYLLNNTAKSCNDYPNITVHVEGGTCNGCFDMRGHGHTNADWTYLKNNMFKGKYLHVKGQSTLLNCLSERVIDPSNTQDVETIMKIWDFCFDQLQSLSGCDQWKASGRYKMMVNNYDNEAGGNPFWGGNYGYSQPGIYKDGVFNLNNLQNIGAEGGTIWVMTHELGHGHQSAINLSGQTESSNNSLAQCVNFLTTRRPDLFLTTRSSRGAGVKGMIDRFNQSGGYSWIDYGGMRTKSGSYDDTWLSNRWLYQLWLYFDGMKHYHPSTNQGYDFISALFDAMREDPLQKSTDKANPKPATQDYLKLARKCAEITQTNLSEFFESWGFWKTTPTVANDNDAPGNHTYYFGDYTSTYVQVTEEMVNGVRDYMKSLPNEGPNLMFLEDRCTGSTQPTYNGATVESFGETGYYGNYSQKISAPYSLSIVDNTVTLSGGTGAVGFKIYDDSGNLVAVSNTTSFTVSSDIATGLADGTYTLVAAQGDGRDLLMGQLLLTLNNALSVSGITQAYGTTYQTVGIELPEGIYAYYLKDERTTKNGVDYIKPTLLGQRIPAETPVLLVGDEDTGTILASQAEVGDVTKPLDNILQGTTTSEVSTGTSHLVLNNNSEGYIGFYNLKSGKSIAAHRAYIPYDAAEAKAMVIQWDDATSIIPVPNGTAPTTLYDLQGRRVSHPSRGLYIQGGKKVVIK